MDALLSLIESKEFIAALVGAVIGGLIAGFFTLSAQNKAAKDQRKRDRESAQEALKGTLQAIETEVDMFKRKFLDAFEKVFLSHPVLPKMVSLRQNVSVVFDSNAAMLGRITDAELRGKIVSTYLTLKAVVDAVNHYEERRAGWEKISTTPNVIGINEIRVEAEKWVQKIWERIPELQTEIADLLAGIRKYIESI
jgi:formiminotetrahydrofolate cyclodeaminase